MSIYEFSKKVAKECGWGPVLLVWAFCLSFAILLGILLVEILAKLL